MIEAIAWFVVIAMFLFVLWCVFVVLFAAWQLSLGIRMATKALGNRMSTEKEAE